MEYVIAIIAIVILLIYLHNYSKKKKQNTLHLDMDQENNNSNKSYHQEDQNKEEKQNQDETNKNEIPLYRLKYSLMTKNEQKYYNVIKDNLSEKYKIFPQINLATIIQKTDPNAYRNELFRNIDFLITDSEYKPLVCIEINDESHNDYKRKQRDRKVKAICEEAGIPLITFWTSYGINKDYIIARIDEAISMTFAENYADFDETEIYEENDVYIENEQVNSQPIAEPQPQNINVNNFNIQSEDAPKEKSAFAKGMGTTMGGGCGCLLFIFLIIIAIIAVIFIAFQ